MKCTNNTADGRKPSAGGVYDDPVQLGYTRREWERINALEERVRKHQYKLLAILIVLSVIALVLAWLVYVSILRSHDEELFLPYDKDHSVRGIGISEVVPTFAKPFSKDLCVLDGDMHTDMLSISALSAELFDLTTQDVLYAKDVFTQRAPASLTKIMTAYVALKYGNLDDKVTVSEVSKNIEYGSSVCDLKVGDTLTLRQLLYGMMVASGNDASMVIAEYIGGGSVSNFVRMMNEEAKALGATRTHFSNPHGLTAENHYSCAYDLYLIFHEAMKSDVFMDIISRKNYYAEYKNILGGNVAVTWETTNHYFTGEAELPESMIIYGGKTGTTEAAGACLAILAKDIYGNPFFAVIMHSQDKDYLYTEMNGLLSLACA